MVENQPTEEIDVHRGVRQDCILSPLLFKLYSEATFRETLEDVSENSYKWRRNY